MGSELLLNDPNSSNNNWASKEEIEIGLIKEVIVWYSNKSSQKKNIRGRNKTQAFESRNQHVSERLEDRHFITPARSSKQSKPTLENSHISRLDLDLDLDFINGQYDYDVNLRISPIKIVYAYRITALSITSFATMCIR